MTKIFSLRHKTCIFLIALTSMIEITLAIEGLKDSGSTGPISLDYIDISPDPKTIQVDSLTVSAPFIEGTEVEFVLKGTALSDISTNTLHF